MIFFLFGCHGTLDAPGTGITNGDGELRVRIPIESQTSLMMMAQSENLIVVKEILDQNGDEVLNWNDWKQSQYRLSNAFLLSSTELSCNWPIRFDDSPLASGTWTFVLGSYDEEGYPSSDSFINVQVSTKEDQDNTTGHIQAWIVTTSTVDEQVQEALEEAVEKWKTLWSNVGLELTVRYGTGASEPLPLVYEGTAEIKDLRNQGFDNELMVIVGESFEDAPEILGFAGNVPGSLQEGKRSAIAISWLANAGTDGVFDEQEIQLFSETLAHEAGHYLGLYHPVEIEFSQWDALSDTEECTSRLSCQQALKNNLMYPYPICMGSTCVEQYILTEQQQAILHQNTGVQ